MRIDALLAKGVTRSFEYFPPKSDSESALLSATLRELEDLHPSFVSVTYRGGRESRQRTFDLVTQIEKTGNTTAMAHLICVGHTKNEMREILGNYKSAGVENVMALGGDIPDDPALRKQFSAIKYTINKRDEIQLISKEDMLKLDPDLELDDIDAFVLTFAHALANHDMAGGEHIRRPQVEHEYDPVGVFEKELAAWPSRL